MCVYVLVICVLVFTVFLYCFVYVYVFFLCFCLIFFSYVFLWLCLCTLIAMYALFCIFRFHRANWHSSATLTEVFLCIALSCKKNARA